MHSLKAIKITDKVYWVGAIDWELRNFHGYQTSRGSTYNAYLILGEKPILIDTVKKPFMQEMLSRIKSIINPEEIKYIISNHAEMDHSGSLPEIMAMLKPEKVYASKIGVQTLNHHFHFQDKNIITGVANGESLTLGNTTLSFLDTKMLHWPESMFTYLASEKILFSQDAFGMHFATAQIFADLNKTAILEEEAAKYFANILMPYSCLVTKLLEHFTTLNLAVDFIAPAHGPIWRNEDVKKVMQLWGNWANKKFYDKAIIIYDSMWQSTYIMAKFIADGLTENGIYAKLMPLEGTFRSDVATEILTAGALLVGSPTLNQEILPIVADVMCYLRGLKPKNLIGQTFGSYGWVPDAQKILTEMMQKMGIELIGEAIKVKYVPTAEDLEKCKILGKNIAEVLKTKIGETK